MHKRESRREADITCCKRPGDTVTTIRNTMRNKIKRHAVGGDPLGKLHHLSVTKCHHAHQVEKEESLLLAGSATASTGDSVITSRKPRNLHSSQPHQARR